MLKIEIPAKTESHGALEFIEAIQKCYLSYPGHPPWEDEPQIRDYV
jgi:hypothetical protein